MRIESIDSLGEANGYFCARGWVLCLCLCLCWSEGGRTGLRVGTLAEAGIGLTIRAVVPEPVRR